MKFSHGSLWEFKIITTINRGESYSEKAECNKQSLLISQNGLVEVSYFLYQEGKDNLLRSKKFMIKGMLAKDVLCLIQENISKMSTENNGDEDCWEADLITRDGVVQQIKGNCHFNNSIFRQVSDEIRKALNTSDLFCFDGRCSKNIIQLLVIKYLRIQQVRLSEITGKRSNETVELTYSEQIEINRKTEEIRISKNHRNKSKSLNQYQLQNESSDFLDYFQTSFFEGEIIGNPIDAVGNPTDIKNYSVSLVYENGDVRDISGSYDKLSLPPKWPEIMETLFEIIYDYGQIELFTPSIYEKTKKRKNELMFVFVIYSDFSDEYTYLCEDESIQKGDLVRVPVGNQGRTTMAEVVRVEYHSEDDAPYPMEKIKKVMKVIEEKDFEEMKKEEEN